jgi:ELWxxDGT repeat protein
MHALGLFLVFSCSVFVGAQQIYVKKMADVGSFSTLSEESLNGYSYIATSLPTNSFGRELYRTDCRNIELVKDINPSGSSNPDHFRVMGNSIYFAAEDATTGIELWVSDGTSSGTTMVADINLGSTDSSPDDLTVLSNVLYFTATDGVTGIELYRYSPGSAPTRVKDIRTTSVTLGPPSSTPSYLTVFNTRLVFSALDDNNGRELWISDGTESGTRMVSDIVSGNSNPSYITAVPQNNPANFVLFQAYGGLGTGGGTELWRSDGTTSFRAADVWPGNTASSPRDLTNINGRVFFGAQAPDGIAVWITDGTTSGTRNVSIQSLNNQADQFAVANGYLYFRGWAAATGRELWRTEGTSSSLVKDIRLGVSNANVAKVTAYSNFVFFEADDTGSSVDLWMTDGTATNTVKVQTLLNPPRNLRPGVMFVSTSGLYFTTSNELFIISTDSTCGGPVTSSTSTVSSTSSVGSVTSSTSSSLSTSSSSGSTSIVTGGSTAGSSVTVTSDAQSLGCLLSLLLFGLTCSLM